MDVTFVNPIDGPCLSLMVPVLSFPLPRAQGAPPGVPRVARRFASLVVGNMCALVIDGRALIPYAPALLPDLAACVKDCNPKMRQYGASALTALLKGMASEYLSQRFENMASSTASGATLWRRFAGEVRGARRGVAGPQCRSSSSWRPRRRRRRTTRRRRCWPRRSGCARRRRRGSRARRRRGAAGGGGSGSPFGETVCT